MPPLDRPFLASSLAAAPGGFDPRSLSPPTRPARARRSERSPPRRRSRSLTSIYRYLSHAYHIAGRFLDGYMKGDEHHFPEFGVASATSSR